MMEVCSSKYMMRSNHKVYAGWQKTDTNAKICLEMCMMYKFDLSAVYIVKRILRKLVQNLSKIKPLFS